MIYQNWIKSNSTSIIIGDIEKYPIIIKDYVTMKGTSVTEYELINNGDKDWIKKTNFISGLVPKNIELLFGKSDFKFKGSEYNIDNWGLKFNDYIFLLNSANKRGTSTESICKDIPTIKGYYDTLVKMFLDLNDIEIDKLKVFLGRTF